MAKIAVVTGGNSGIGQPLSVKLAKAGYDLLFLNRSRARSEELLRAVRAARPGASAEVIETDLTDHASVRAACAAIAERTPQVHALFNNAGVLTRVKSFSPQGQDSHFQVNTVSPYLIMRTLRPQLAAAKGARVLNTGSSAMSEPFVGPLRVDRLTDPPRMDILGAYAQSKMALAVLGEIVAPDFQGDGIIVRTACPGANRTTMTKTGDGMPWILQALVPLFFAKPEMGAERLYGAQFDPKFGDQTGIYVDKGKVKPLPKGARDRQARAALMRLLDKLVAA